MPHVSVVLKLLGGLPFSVCVDFEFVEFEECCGWILFGESPIVWFVSCWQWLVICVRSWVWAWWVIWKVWSWFCWKAHTFVNGLFWVGWIEFELMCVWRWCDFEISNIEYVWWFVPVGTGILDLRSLTPLLLTVCVCLQFFVLIY